MLIDDKTQKELREKYNPDGSELREMQIRILRIMNIIDDICVRNNIPYWLSSGTLLGAVRHDGFIPWDDDLDIDMLRRDIPRFIKACEKELPEGFAIQTHKTDPEYYLNIIKVRDESSEIKEKFRFKNGKEEDATFKYRGLFVDILPIEKSSLFLCKLSGLPMSLLNKAIYYWSFRKWMIEIIYNFNQLIYSCFRGLSCLLFWEKDYYVTYGTWFFRKRSMSDIFPLTRIKFENSEFYAPNNCDAYLKKIFGNYMTLPPVDMRRPMHDSNLSEKI